MDTTNSSLETVEPHSPRSREVRVISSPAAGVTGGCVVHAHSCLSTSGEAAVLAQTVSRFEGALGEMRVAQAQMQVEVLRLGKRVDAAQHLALVARLDELSADVRRERQRRGAGEALLQKAIGEISRAVQPQEFPARSSPRSGLLPRRECVSSSATVQELLQHLDRLRSTEPGSPSSCQGGFASSSTSTAADLLELPLQDPSAATVSPAREAYEELFAKKARCFEQAVNMIETTAASVTKRLEAVLSESSAAMRREACDRAQAKAEIQRALQEFRTASDRASAVLPFEPSGNALGRLAPPRNNLCSGMTTPAAATQSSVGSGAPGGDAAGGAGISLPQRMASSSLVPTASSGFSAEVEAAIPDARSTIARSGSESLTFFNSASTTSGHKAVTPSVGMSNAGQTVSGSSHVLRASSQPQHTLSQDSAGSGTDTIIVAAQSMKDVSSATSDLTAIAEQQQALAPSPRKHVVLAPKALGSAASFSSSNAGNAGTGPSHSLSGANATSLQATAFGGSALFRQVQKQGGAPPPSLPSTNPATSVEASRVSQNRLVASTPRPGKQNAATSGPPPAQHLQVQGQHATAAGVTGISRQGTSGQQQAQPQQHVGWTQNMPTSTAPRADDTTPVACGARPGSVPPGMRVPGRSLAAGTAVMRFTSK